MEHFNLFWKVKNSFIHSLEYITHDDTLIASFWMNIVPGFKIWSDYSGSIDSCKCLELFTAGHCFNWPKTIRSLSKCHSVVAPAVCFILILYSWLQSEFATRFFLIFWWSKQLIIDSSKMFFSHIWIFWKVSTIGKI